MTAKWEKTATNEGVLTFSVDQKEIQKAYNHWYSVEVNNSDADRDLHYAPYCAALKRLGAGSHQPPKLC